MEIQGWMVIAGGAAAVVLFVVMVGMVLARFYQRASADEALVRTGSGGVKVVIGGGTLCLPVLHQIMRVSLRTVTLTVERQGNQALVTADKIKACCTMELYIKVDSEKQAIIKAAQSFGVRNVDSGVLSEIVEGKLTDALRGVAANKNFAELHAKREEFAEAVKEALVHELEKNGLKLESTSLTDLSQLPIGEMNKNDVHDAVGLRNILSIVSDAQMQSNKIENERDVTIQQQNVNAKKVALNLDKQKAMLEADQTREVAEYEATQASQQKTAVLAQEQAAAEAELAQKREVDNAKIAQEEAVETRNLQRQRVIAEETARKQEAERTAQISAQKAIETAEIERAKAVEAASIAKQQVIEAAEIEKTKTVEAAQVEKERTIEAARVAKRQIIETAEITKAVAIAQADTEKAEAEALKALAEAKEAEARESVTTAEERARAERKKTISIVQAEEEAQRDRIDADKNAYVAEVNAVAAFVVAEKRADAEKAEAEGVANAVRERAKASADERTLEAQGVRDAAEREAEADALRITVKAKARSEAATLDAESKKLLADALLAEGQAEAEAKRLLVEAENAVDDRLLLRDVAMKAIEVSPAVVGEFVKAAEGIDLKVVQVNGLGGSGENGDGNIMGDFAKTPFGLGIGTLAQYSAVKPALKLLLSGAGVSPEDGGALVEKVKSVAKAGFDALTKPSEKATPPAAPSNRIADSVSKAKKKPRSAKPSA